MSVTSRNLVIWLVLVFSLALGGCTKRPDVRGTFEPGTGAITATKPAPANSVGTIALDTARNMLGVTYRYGGSDPRGFDCSGLVQYSFRQAGVYLPRTSQDIFRASTLVNPAEILPGDLVFFRVSAKKVSHVGIYAGSRTFIHSPSSGKGVSYASLDSDYWSQRLIGVGRI